MASVKAREGQNPKWVRCDLSNIFENATLQTLMDDILNQQEVTFTEDKSAPAAYDFPDFGANRLQPTALKHLCEELSEYLERAVSPLSEIPVCMILQRRAIVWERVIEACEQQLYSGGNLRRVIAALRKEEDEKGEGKTKEKTPQRQELSEKLSGNDILIEVGVKTGLSVVFSLLKQAWAQLAWQRQIEQQLQATGALVPFATPQVNLPNEILRSVLDVLKAMPPLSLANVKTLSSLSLVCLEQSTEFIRWVLSPDSWVDGEGKRLTTEILFSLALQYGNLNSLVEWVDKMLACLIGYEGKPDVPQPSLSLGFCQGVLEEIRRRTQVGILTETEECEAFEPKELTADGHVSLLEFTLFLCQELAHVSRNCTQYFNKGESEAEDRFLSETCEVYAFGSNSSSQLAMGSTEKFPRATLLQHMANCQVVEAGQYCSFLFYGDGTVKGCGKGSYGRLGLGNSDTQTSLKNMDTLPAGTVVRKMATSRGSDGHTMAITDNGQVYSWGDGNYGKLGHGDNVTHKVPKLISAFADKVVRHVTCGNRHSAAVTIDGELYTWGEGDYGRLGHGNTATLKTPTKVERIEPVRQVACGAAHTLALSMDGLTVWSFGSGDSGKLGHGDTNRQTSPKVIEGLRGVLCQKVCAASQFSIILTTTGKAYSFGNGSGVGKGTTEPRQYSPWLIEVLDEEMIIDITTGDGHCLALTQRGEVYSWGTNSMGQCGQGHSNGSITTPSKVQGLDGVQVQQISAGTSHSVVWTAVPKDRRASAMWHWPYCVSVGEKTFQHLLNLLNQYGNVGDNELPPPPFKSRESQESFVFSILSLTRTHLSLAAPLGPSCVHMACGPQVKPLRNFLFKLIDSQLPPALDQVTSEALEVGSSVLLPPVLDRLDLLLSILPEDPLLLPSLSVGQLRQLNVLLSGFQERGEFVGILVDEACLDEESPWICTPHAKKLFALCDRMVDYLHEATLTSLDSATPVNGAPLDSATPLNSAPLVGSHLLKTFEQFLLSVFVNMTTFVDVMVLEIMEDVSEQLDMQLTEKLSVLTHFESFYNLMKDHSLAVIRSIAARAKEAEDPVTYLQSVKDVLFGFLAYEFPSHMAIVVPRIPAFSAIFDLDDLLLETARAVHEIVLLLPPALVEGYEKDELHWEPINVKPERIKVPKLREGDTAPWRNLADLERLLCWTSGKIVEFMYISRSVSNSLEMPVLEYSPGKGKPSLVSSHLLSNGVIGDNDQLAEAIYTWQSLCKTLPENSESPDDEWACFTDDYDDMKKTTPLDLLQDSDEIKACEVTSTTFPLLALAVGARGNSTAEMIYNNMMDFATHRDWNTCSDEASLPQLRQVSCASLACLLNHTGLYVYAVNCSTRPKKKLVDVYRAVFSLRREVFTNRPIPNSEGEIAKSDQVEFLETCNGICATLIFLMCVLNPALPEESEPIVPQITTTAPSTTPSSADDVCIRSPGSTGRLVGGLKGPVRLFSVPETRDDSTPISPQKQETPITHSASHTAPSPTPHEQGWSLQAVKQALSRLRWHRDRMDMHATISTGLEGSLHQKICGVIVDIVSQAFQSDSDLLGRKKLLSTLMIQQTRAMHRRDALVKILKFISEGKEKEDLLPSARLIYLSHCLAHDVHYSENISAAPSVLQHEIKSLSHSLLEEIVSSVLRVDPSDLTGSSTLGLHRQLLLAMQWINFPHEPSDLHLLFNGDLYSKMATLSGIVSSSVTSDVSLPSTRLASGLRMACVLIMQLLSLRVGMNAEVLKSRPDILAVVSEHLYGQLEGYISTNDPQIMRRWEDRECTMEEREGLLGDFLSFVNTFSATHEAIRGVLASDVWFGTLLRIVDIDTATGVPVVASLKTRMLALEVLGAIMVELSDTSPEAHAQCAKIIEDLLELMYRCMFLAPVSHFQDNLKPIEPTTEGQLVVLPFAFDPSNQHSCRVVMENDCSVVEGSGGNGYALGQVALNSGKYTWKVSVECDNAAFCVGVGQKPLSNRRVGSSAQFWAMESHTGRLYHEGESNDLLFTLTQGDSIVVEYDSTSQTLSYGKNNEDVKVVFQNVVKQAKDLYPMVLFPRRNNTTTVRFHPINHCSHSPLAHLKRHEQITSGYPLLSPTGVTMAQAVIGILYHLQEREPWNRAIGQVICSKLSEMDVLIHRLLYIEMELGNESSSQGGDAVLTPLALIINQLSQVVWPCLAVIGGLDTGLCLGRQCQMDVKGESVVGTIVSTPDSEQKLEVQDQVTSATAEVKKRTVSLSSLKLLSQSNFSLPLIADHLTPAILMNITHLAGYLDHKHSLSSILQQAHTFSKYMPQVINKCLPYQRLCESLLQMAATKSLHTILYDETVIKLLSYQSPSMEVVIAGGYVDKSELAQSVREVLKCLAMRAIKPSPLKPALRLLELERVHAVLSYECLASVAEYMYHHGVPAAPPEDKLALQEPSPPSSPRESPSDTPLADDVVGPQAEEGNGDGGEEGSGEQAARTTPLLMHTLLDMGFSRAQINVALSKCEIPPNTNEQQRMHLLVSWVIDHPDAVMEEEARLEQVQQEQEVDEKEQEQKHQQEADQTAAANEFLSLCGEMFDGETGESTEEVEVRKDTKHAPDLLEGPDVNEEVPDVRLSGLDTSPQSLKSLLSALGLSQKRPTPRRFEFSKPDPLGENLCRLSDEGEAEDEGIEGVERLLSQAGLIEEDVPGSVVKIGSTCEDIVQQVQKLRSLDENVCAINRILSATQTLVARQVTMLVIASLSTYGTQSFIENLRALNLVDVKSLVRLLRLVHAGRIDSTPGKIYSLKTQSSLLPIKGLDCLGSAITTVVTDSLNAGSQLMQACSRDLLAAAVGGADLLQKTTRRRRERGEREKESSDVTILSNPSFSVSQSLVQTMAEAAGKAVFTDNSGVLQMTDALAACLFSSKLEPEHRFWALEQLLKMFSTTRKDLGLKLSPEDVVAPSQLVHLTGHKGQIMACAENKREKRVVSIGEDNSLVVWDLDGGLEGQPETKTYSFPEHASTPSPGLLLPTLTQSFNHTCVAGALNDQLCVWRVRDGSSAQATLPELITTLQWKPSQKEGEAPLLLVGLVDGQLVLVEVLRASVNLAMEIQTTILEHLLKGAICSLAWSPGGSKFAVASTPGCVQVYSGLGREYVATLEMKDIQVNSLSWSPDESLLATLEADGTLKLWDTSGEAPSVAHTFDAYRICSMTWHSTISDAGDTLLAGGCQDGTVHLWAVEGKRESNGQSESGSRVSHVTSLLGHQAPITTLAFSESAALLASGCRAGSVRIWDIQSFEVLKVVTRAVGEVLNIAWTSHGLTVCYKNTSTLCLLPPGPSDYLGERCIHSCLPTLHLHGITDPSKAPCLTALLKNLHHVLLDQYQYEEGEVCSGQQIVHSEYLQLLTALSVGLGLHHVLISPPHPPHFSNPTAAKEWQWLNNFNRSLKMAEALSKRTPLPPNSGFSLPKDLQQLDPAVKYQPTDNSVWTLTMDNQILEWVTHQPEQWWQSIKSGVYTWGKGSWNQLGHSTREKSLPAVVEDWKDVQQIVAGSYSTYVVKFDGTVASVGEGSYGRLGHGGSDSESNLRIIAALQGIPVVQVVAGPRVSTSTDEGFALALTDAGDVYSWGKGYKGRLGHTTTENTRSPKLVEALAGKDIKMIACCDYQCAAVTTNGDLYTFGSKENGKLGLGRDTPSGSVGHVTQVTRFLDSDEQTELANTKIGYVSCGQTFTIVVTQDGTRIFGFGKADHCGFGMRGLSGDHHYPLLLGHLSAFGPFVKSASGNRVSALTNTRGQLCWFGKLCESHGAVEAELVQFSADEKIVDVTIAGQYMLALTEHGDVYSWGKNSGNTCELGYESSPNPTTPKLISALNGKGIKQISAGIRHAVCCDTSPPVRGVTNIAIPSSIPAQYSALKDVPCQAIHARLLLLNHFAKVVIGSWRLFSTHVAKPETARFHINPLSDGCTRSLISPQYIEGMVAGVVSRTMVTKSHGPSITVQRIAQDDRASKPVFPQIATQILQKTPKELRCPSRAWKVNLVGEGADDAGGVFDETMAQMCEELEGSIVKGLIPTPNATNKCGFNTDRYVFDPSCTSSKDLKHFKFLGILFGVAMRTKKPLDLHLAQPMWKLLAGMSLTAEDLEEVDLLFIQTLYGIRDVHKGGIKEEDFSEMIPIESFEAQSMNGKFVPIVPGGGNIKLTFHNRKEYVEKALHFRLHEFDQQVAAVREGMAWIVPVPLLSLCTAKMLETTVCGHEEVDLQMLKKVVRYRDNLSENDQLVQWLWQTLEAFTNEEKILFLRFVSGRSRLPNRVSEIPQRFQIMKWGQSTDALPTSQTCFFQIRLPNYSSHEMMADKLRYAIRHCRSIDMDTYMLRRSNTSDYEYDSEDDDW